MTTVTEGMDVAKVRNVATAMLSLAARVDDVRGAGSSQVVTLEGAWSGEDLETFSDGWHDALPGIYRTSAAMRGFGRDLHHQADQQQEASGFGPGAPGPVPPLPPLPPILPPIPTGEKDGRGLLDRLWDGVKDVATRAWEGFKKIASGILDLLTHPWAAALVFIKDVAKFVYDQFEKVKNKVVGLVTKGANFLKKWAPKLLELGKKALPVLKVLGKFAKAIPILNVGLFLWDAKDVFVDLWNGEINPHEFWNKIILGGASTIAGFFPGVGTVISLALAGEQLRSEFFNWADTKLADALGIPKWAVTVPRAVIMAPLSPLGLFDMLPDENFDLPGPSPKEAVTGGWEAIKDVARNDPGIGFNNPTPGLPEPWGRWR